MKTLILSDVICERSLRRDLGSSKTVLDKSPMLGTVNDAVRDWVQYNITTYVISVILYLTHENLADSDPVIVPNKAIYYLIWYNDRVTVRQIFVNEA